MSTEDKTLDSNAQTEEMTDVSSIKTASNTGQQQVPDTDGSTTTADQQVIINMIRLID